MVTAAWVWAWPPVAGVWLAPGERLQVALPAAVLAALLAASGRRLGLSWLGVAALPAVALEATAWLPTVGKLRVHVDGWALAALGVAVLLVAVALRTRARSVVAVALLLGGIGSAVARHGTRKAAPDQPPIVLLTLDTLRADHLAGFGGDVATAHTPHLDAFFAQARVFRAAYATLALTGPSHATMLSGLGVERHHVTVNGQVLPDTLPWVPAELHAAGWHTRAVVSAAVLDASLGFARGFDRYDSTFEDRAARAYAFLNRRGYRPRAGSTESRAGADSLARVDRFERGTFTWIHLYDAHWPYTPTPEAGARVGLGSVEPLPQVGLGRQIDPSDTAWPPEQVARGKLLYRAELEDLDRLVGAVLARVPTDATVVLTGDHGESLDEHGYVFSHGRLPFSPDVRTPLAVRAPGVAPEWVDTPVSLARIADTLRFAAGLSGWKGGPPSASNGAGAPDRGLLGPIDAVPVLSIAYTSNFVAARAARHPLGPVAGVALRSPGHATVWTQWHAPAAYAVGDPRELVPLPIVEGERDALAAAAGRSGQAAEPEPEMRAALEALGYLEGPAGGAE